MKKHKLLLVLLLLAGINTNIFAQAWTPDPTHSRLGFTAAHLMISDVTGNFSDFTLSINATKSDFSDATVLLTANTTSINTGVEARDNHLRSADFFDAEQYPTITYIGTKVDKLSDNKYRLVGSLTIHGVTKQIILDVEHRGTITNSTNKKETAGFKVTGKLNRLDFGVGPNFPKSMISDEIQIIADIEVVKD